MEPLAPAVLAGLTPPDVRIRFYDDRIEPIPFDESTDLVAMSVETYTAKRAYQIASAYRQRGVPVVMGGFHPTLVPEEASDHAESIVVGEAERLWAEVIEDYRRGRQRRVYAQATRPSLRGMLPDRSIFAGKRYLPIGLVEAARGCALTCEFCAIQAYYESTQTWRPVDDVIRELRTIKKRLIFFVDDNIVSDIENAKTLLHALIPLKLRWVSQATIHAAYDEQLLGLMKESGCQGLLIGLETLNPDNLKRMNKTFNRMKGGYEEALANLRRYGIRLYATFILGYDHDTERTVREHLEFALKHRFYIAAFNHLTPFPGTPLYRRLKQERRLLYDRWWLHPDYCYGMVPHVPKRMSPEMVTQLCLQARTAFYSLPSILKRSMDYRVNANSLFMWSSFFVINRMIRREVLQRRDFPLGDEAYAGPLIRATHGEPLDLKFLEARELVAEAGAV
jgi:radical SAM superfamily enzyme YgiQ (UPF0313 family)